MYALLMWNWVQFLVNFLPLRGAVSLFKEVVKCLRKQNGADRVWNLGQVRNNVGNTP